MGSDLGAVSAAYSAEVLAKWEEVIQYGKEQSEITNARNLGAFHAGRGISASVQATQSTLNSMGDWYRVVNMRDENAEAARLGLNEVPNPNAESDWAFSAQMQQTASEHSKKQNEMVGDLFSWEPNSDPNAPSSLQGAQDAMDATNALLGTSSIPEK